MPTFKLVISNPPDGNARLYLMEPDCAMAFCQNGDPYSQIIGDAGVPAHEIACMCVNATADWVEDCLANGEPDPMEEEPPFTGCQRLYLQDEIDAIDDQMLRNAR